MKSIHHPLIFASLFAFSISAFGQGAKITVDASQVLHPISRYLTGACIEDVNHEIYGGIYSQMIFGESFQEPAPQPPLNHFNVFGGRWTLTDDGGIRVVGGDGAKMVWDSPAFSEGEASVDVWLTESTGGNAGLILKVKDAAEGADTFDGYEVSLESPGILVLGRHRQDWEPIQRVPCHVPLKQWVHLTARMTANKLELLVNDQSMLTYEDTDHPLEMGQVGLRSWQHDVRFRNFSVTTAGQQQAIPFELMSGNSAGDAVSGMWRGFRRGAAEGGFSIEKQNPFVGQQSQQMILTSGDGEIGVENEGLNRWGMNFVKGKEYVGHLWVRAVKNAEIFAALESKEGAKVYAEKTLDVKAGDWQRLDFELRPNATAGDGRFAIKLKRPGAVTLGYVFLEPGAWGRFKGLPVRKDVAEGLVHQGITVLRYGGSMVNAEDYHWKQMVGPRDKRPPYDGHWYPYSSNGWGIFDFLNLCGSAGFLGIPDLNVNESPQDLADFMDYVNGPTSTTWGAQRAADGHPASYHLRYMELGNEERVDDTYFDKFKALAETIWAKDPDIILIVGDFAYNQVIKDPFHFSGADGHITTLAAQQKILQLAEQHHREVWFDVHVFTEGPRPSSSLEGAFSFDTALGQIADGAKYKVLIFELNANNPTQRRALANAMAINAAERDGRLPIVCSANCLQPDGQNDNAWDQGLLFLDPSQVWLQPPGYVTKMYSNYFETNEVWSHVEDAGQDLDVSAQCNADGKILVLKVANLSDSLKPASLVIRGYSPGKKNVEVVELAGPKAMAAFVSKW